ncbi:MAG: AraC family transcriptional regulator [Anaerolineaceae bacterium]|nr:MAG: AraC family transcriptional regulator [Anaerolineaceae bacterium]
MLSYTILYEKEYLVEIGSPSDNLYYFFDYDERSYDINMEFQHFHHFYEMHILLDSEANHIIEGNLYGIKLYDIVCLKPTILHKSEYPEGPPRKRLIIQFNIPILADILREQFNQVMSIFEEEIPIYRFDTKEQEVLNNLLNDIFSISKAKSSLSTLFIHNKFTEFLCAIYKFRKENRYKPEDKSTTTSKIYSVASYIHNHFAEELSLDILASKFYLSNYYISHLFKEVTGFTLINYIQMTRTRNAQQLLLFTDTKITEIAEKCGFTSFSQFNRVFNKYCKTSPRKYRQQGHLDNNFQTIPTLFTRD